MDDDQECGAEGDPDIEKFRSRIKRLDTPCWLWVGATTLGYGKVRFHGIYESAHRVSYELAYGPIPDGLQIDHLCRNHGCVNPEHLEAVTQAENIRRGHPFRRDLRNNPPTHCPSGHAIEGENLVVVGGYTVCRQCHNAYNRVYAAQHPSRSHGYVPTGNPPGRPRGRLGVSGESKLTLAQIADIYRMLDERKMRQREIARHYGVGEATISRMKTEHRRQRSA